MRRITEIIVHCAATRRGQEVTVAQITKWHKDRGFRTIGYHWVVYLNGSVHAGRPEAQIGAHVKGHNTGTIGICYVGGVDADDVRLAEDTRTDEQKAALLKLIKGLIARYPTIKKISGHNQYANKACPSFDAQAEYKDIIKDQPKPVPIPDADTVRVAQQLLKDKGYPEVGEVDGDMGSKTRGALLAFKADNDLPLTPDLDDATMVALMKAPPRPIAPERAEATLDDLRKRGSRNVRAADNIKTAGVVAGGVGAVGGAVEETGVLDRLTETGETVGQINDAISPLQSLVQTFAGYWWVAVLLIGGLLVWQAVKAHRARLEDHRTGKTG